jgi:hypothetical protein
MAFDIASKHTCYHVISGVNYLPVQCPRCHGRGFYYDLLPHTLGQVALITGSDKLVQQLEKAFLEQRRPSGWGFNHKALVGLYQVDTIKALLTSEIVATLSFVKQQQQSQLQQGISLTASELIDQAGDLEIVPDLRDPRRWTIRVKVVTAARTDVQVVVPLQLNTVPQ